MDTFIVRIYRQMARSVDEPAGTIEHVESGNRLGFAGASELLDGLLAPRRKKHNAATLRRPRRKEPKP